MLHLIGLLLPVLMPSWRFFKTVAPSPRIEVALGTGDLGAGELEAGDLGAGDLAQAQWRELCPRPERVSFARMLRRMLWNARWNEHLFLVSYAERLIAAQDEGCAHPHALGELERRVRDALVAQMAGEKGPKSDRFRFRLVFVWRAKHGLQRDIDYVSEVLDLSPQGRGARP